MLTKTSELSGAALDWAVAKCEGYIATFKPDEVVYVHPLSGEWHHNGNWSPSTKWVQGGPIIEREKIALCPDSNYELRGGRWSAVDWGGNLVEFGSAPLIAAMRCYVASKLGDEVDVPEELLV